MLMDVGGGLNGALDGKADLVYVDHDINPDYKLGMTLGMYTVISKGDGTWTPTHTEIFDLTYSVEFPPYYVARHWLPMDVNGDGRDDLVHIYYNGGGGVRLHTLLSNGDGTWATEIGLAWITPSVYFKGSSLTYADTRNWRPADVNGDGKMDLVLVNVEAGQEKVRTLLSSFTSNTVKWTPITDALAPPSGISLNFAATWNWRAMEVNGDGMTDLVYIEYQNVGVNLYLLLSKGNGTWQADHTATMSALSPVKITDTQNFKLMDMNRDGKTDLVHVSTYVDSSGILETAVFLITNNYPSWRTNTQIGIPFHFTDPRSWRTMDSDGDGTPDLVYVHPDIYSLHWPTPLDRITQDSNRLGGVITVNYSPSSSFRTNNSSQGCHLPIGAVMQVVSTVTVEDGRHSFTDAETYSYNCARWSYKERRFLTWEEVTASTKSLNNQPGRTTLNRYKGTDECLAQLTYMQIHDNTGKAFQKTIIAPVNPGTAAPYHCLVNYRNEVMLNQTAIGQNIYTYYHYDEFGNITNIFEHGADLEQNDDERTTKIVYNPAVAPYIVGLPWEVVVSRGVPPNVSPPRRNHLLLLRWCQRLRFC